MNTNLVIVCVATLLIAIIGSAVCLYVDKKDREAAFGD